MFRFLFAGLTALFLTNAASASTLLFQGVAIEWAFGADGDDIYSNSQNGTYTVGPGPEVTFFGLVQVDVTENSIDVTIPFTTRFSSRPFNGVRISDVNGTIPSFASLVPTGAAVSASIATLTDDAFYLNFGAAGVIPGGTVFSYSYTVVPLGASLPLLLTGIGGLMLGRRKAKRAAIRSA